MSTLRLPTTVAAILDELNSGNPRGYLALSELMEFDHPVTVHEDGTVTDGPADVYAPDLYDDELSPSDRWTLLDGYSGQDRYSGPVMHGSEFIGGGMARGILAEPGTYVAVAAYWSPTRDDAASDCEVCEGSGEDGGVLCECTQDADTIEGWAVARLID